MGLIHTALEAEVSEITNKGPSPVHYYWRAELLANEEVVEP